MPENSHLERQKPRIPPLGPDFNDWIKNNWGVIRCYASEASALSLWMWRAARAFEVGPGGVASGMMVWEALEAGQRLATCGDTTPPIEDLVQPSTKECQCAKQSGTLVARIDAGLGAEAKEDKSGLEEAKEILDVYGDGNASFCKYKTPSGIEKTAFVTRLDVYEKFDVDWYIRPQPGTVCCDELPDPPPEPPGIPDIPLTGTPHPDHESCYGSIRYLDSYIDNNGILFNKWRFYSYCPGYITSSYCYWESIYGIEIVDCDHQFPPHPPVPQSCQISGLSQVRYSVSAGCTWNEEEQKYDTVYDAIVDETDDGILGLAWRLDAIAWLLEKVNLIPYGICGNDTKPQLAPHWRSIRFESEEYTDRGNRRLDKLLRYRGAEPGDIEFLAGYWGDFEWTTGPVIVYHKGSPVGTPKVWADSEEEGKRVIRHAFGEAGFDADQIGEWGVSGSSDPRYGVRRKVKLKVVDGCWSATSRPGPGGWPEAGVALPDSYESGSNIKKISGIN